MYDQAKAADFFVVAWCKNWTLGQYLDVITGQFNSKDDLSLRVGAVSDAYPWLPSQLWQLRAYGRPVRELVSMYWPNLSDWLWSRKTDIDRLKCASQVPKLRPTRSRGRVSEDARSEMKQSSKMLRQATTSYRASRDAFKTHQGSAWNVCK